MKKRVFSLILAIIMLGAFLAGCGADPTPSDPAPANDAPASSAASADTPSSGDVTQLRFLLDVSEDSEQGKEFAVLLQQFHDENPDIKVNLEIATTDDMKTKIRTESDAGSVLLLGVEIQQHVALGIGLAGGIRHAGGQYV